MMSTESEANSLTTQNTEVITTTEVTADSADDPFNPDWIKSQAPPMNPEYAASTVTTATVSTTAATVSEGSASATVGANITGSSSTSSVPSHSEFYAPQPTQLSEAEEIAKKKAEQEKKGYGGAIGGAAAIAGVAGLMLVGPLVGVAAAGGAAYVAATNKGAAGSVLRASGKGAAVVGSSARKFDQKHQVVAKTGRGIATGVGWISSKMRKNKPQNS